MKKFLIIIGSLLSLLIGAVLIVPSFIDWTGYRADIAKSVKEATGRDLLIGGDIAFSLLPSPVLRVNDIHLANADHAKKQDMIAVRQLDVRVALMPLLAGNVHVQSIRLIEPVFNLEMLATGQGNWVLNKQGTASNNLETAPQTGTPIFDDEDNEEDSDSSFPLQIDSFIIEKGELFYADPTSGVKEHIKDINSRFSIAGLNGPLEAAGTLSMRGIPMGFEGSVGRIVHGRTASFITQIEFAHGKTLGRLSGTFVNLASGPKVNGKINFKGDSLADFISAFQADKPLAGGLNRAFNMDGEITYGPSGLILGKEGLNVTLGKDHGNISVQFDETPARNLKASVKFSKIDANLWLNAKPYIPKAPQPLALVITPSKEINENRGGTVSAALSAPARPQKEEIQPPTEQPLALPKDIKGQISLSIDALILKDKAVRQLQTLISLDKGELALERLSAILPGAGEISLIGVAGPREGKLQFDGNLDLSIAHLRGFLDWLDIETANIPSERLQNLSLHTTVSANEDDIRLIDLMASIDSSSLKGAATIALRARPSFGVNLSLDQVNLDAYQSQTAPIDPRPTAPENPNSAPKTNVPPDNNDLASVIETLNIFNGFDANLSLALGHLVYKGHDVRQSKLDATIYNGGVEIRTASIKDFAGVQVNAKGQISQTDKGVFAQNLTFAASGKNWRKAAQVLDAGNILDWKKVGPLAISASLNGNLLAPDLDLNTDLFGGSIILAANTDLFPLPKGEATLNLQFPDMNKVLRAVGGAYKPSGKIGPLELSTDIAFDLTQLSLNNIKGKLAATPISGTASFKKGKRAYLGLVLQTGSLRLDPFMPQKMKTPSQTSSVTASKPSRTSAPKAQAKQHAWSQQKFDLSSLRQLDADVQINIDSVSHEKLTLKNAILKAQLKDAVLDINDATADLFNGTIQLTSKLDVKTVPTSQVTLKARKVSLKQALIQTGQDPAANGLVNVSTTLRTQGESQADLISKLNGTVNLNVQKIALNKKSEKGSVFDLLNLLAVLSGTNPKSGLADVHLQSEINQGVAALTKADLISNIAGGNAQGHVDFPQWLIDVSGSLQVKQNALIGLLAQKAKMKSSYPFSIKGSLDAPNIKLDTGGISSGGGLIIPLPDKIDKKDYGNLIRGLLGGKTSTVQPPATPTPLHTQNPDGSMPPPPPPGGESPAPSSAQPSKKQLLLQGLGALLNR